MHKISRLPGLRPGPRWGSLQRSQDPLAGVRGRAPGKRVSEQHITGYTVRAEGRLKMREWKNGHGRKCRGGKGGSGSIGTILQGWKIAVSGSGNIGKDRYCRMLC